MVAARFRSIFLGLALMVVSTHTAGAQPAALPFEKLKPLPSTTKVIVTDWSGQQYSGWITETSAAQLSLRMGRTIRQFPAAEVRSVRMRKPDSVVNGALIGALAGGGLTSLLFLDNECRDDPACYKAVAAYGCLGALLGAGIDAMIHHDLYLYTARATRPPRAVGVTPILSRGKKSLQVTVRF